MGGGTVSTAGNSCNGGGTNGYVNLRGTLSVDSPIAFYSGNLHLETSVAGGASTISIATGSSLRFAGIISNGDNGLAAQLNKTGSGNLFLSSSNTYTGGIVISGGNVITLAGTGSATGSGPVRVNSLATLSGNGNIGGTVTANAGSTVAPGVTAGRLTVTCDATLTAGSTLAVDLYGTIPTTLYDQLFLSGQLTLSGNLSINLLGGFTPAVGTVFTIIDDTGSTLTGGTFANAPAGIWYSATAGTFAVNYAANDDGGLLPNDVTLTYLSAVPEPSTAMLLLGGGLAAGLTRMRGTRRVRRA